MKALPICVYKNCRDYDCTNGGISSRYNDRILRTVRETYPRK